jgi:hypothetical protein
MGDVLPAQSGVVRAPEPDGGVADDAAIASAASWESVAANMQSAQALLAAGDVGEVTQQRQREIIAGLDAMISAAQSASRQQPSQSPSEQDPKNAGGDSTAAGDNAANPNAVESVERHGSEKVENPDAAGPRRTAAQEYWGSLPERIRQQVLQTDQPRSIPKYRDAIEEYFQRLLESQDSAGPPREE